MRRLAAGLARCSAFLILLALLVVLPVVVWAGVGGPGGVDWRTALTGGRVDAETVLALGLVVFTLLWLWFAATAASEVAHVLAWRQRNDLALAPVDPTPSGAIRRLVRIALVSTSTVVGAGLASIGSMPGAIAGVGPSVARAAAMESPVASVSSAPGAPHGSTAHLATGAARFAGASPTNFANELRSNGRDTPYSIAVRLGDPSLREAIVELNRGSVTPDGGTWTSGVFPVGMHVQVPAGVQLAQEIQWQPYTVVEGDSVYRIATRLADGDNRRVRELADAIIDRNLGRTMVDGKAFDDPSLVRIGWVLDVPADASTAAAAHAVTAVTAVTVAGEGIDGTTSTHHTVVAGESYWSIAEALVEPPADAPSDVAALVEELQQRNVDHLGHPDRAMLHPGDELELPTPPPAVAPVAAPASPPSATPDTIPVTIPAAPAVAATSATDTPGDVAPVAPVAPVVLSLPPTTATSPAPTSTAPPDTPATSAATGAPPHTPYTPAASPAEQGGGADPVGDVTAAAVEARSPMTTSLAAAVLLCAGALGLVESRRRQQLRRAGPFSAALVEPTEELMRTERLVRSLDATQRAVRLDIALRSAGHLLVGTGGYVRAAIVDDDGTLTVLLDRPGRPASEPWRAGAGGDRWVLPGAVPNDDVAPMARLAGQPCPAMIHLGRLALDGGAPSHGELFIDLEAFGLVCLDAGAGDPADPEWRVRATEPIVRAIATSLAASPMAETLRLVTHGLDPAVHLGNLNAEAADDLEHALDLAAAALGSTPTAIGGLRTSELRARGVGGEAWEPVVVVSTADEPGPAAVRELLDLTRAGGRSLAVVLGHAVEGASLTVRATAAGWDLAPLGLTVVPVGVDDHHVHELRRLLEAAETPLVEVAPVAAVSVERRGPHPSAGTLAPLVATTPFVDPAWALMIRVLGAVAVCTSTGDAVAFDRGKSLELVTWLGQHRHSANRGAARAALWELEVRDATFSNVVSDARRSLAKAVTPDEGDDWIGRTLTAQLPLHPLVVTDADLLRARLDHARGLPSEQAIEVLRPGVALIRDLPFAGTDYLWPAAEGITSSLTLLATTAATELARHHLALGDVDGVFWSTGQGLLALPGHEELIGLRMRAHAQRGDLAGVRGEWEHYERAIVGDAWSDGEPSPKLLALRRELLNR